MCWSHSLERDLHSEFTQATDCIFVDFANFCEMRDIVERNNFHSSHLSLCCFAPFLSPICISVKATVGGVAAEAPQTFHFACTNQRNRLLLLLYTIPHNPASERDISAAVLRRLFRFLIYIYFYSCCSASARFHIMQFACERYLVWICARIPFYLYFYLPRSHSARPPPPQPPSFALNFMAWLHAGNFMSWRWEDAARARDIQCENCECNTCNNMNNKKKK